MSFLDTPRSTCYLPTQRIYVRLVLATNWQRERYVTAFLQNNLVLTHWVQGVAYALKVPISNLPYAGGAGCREEKGCIEGTWEAFLEDVFDRMTAEGDGPIRIYGLENLAGVGKTAIAHPLDR